MIIFPNSKINLGLHILRKRADGFHDLKTVFYPIPLQDALEIIYNTENRQNELRVTGISIDGSTSDNICLKAVELLKQRFPDLPPIKIHLHKVIPTGAGLGGGSADGAFTLIMLNKKFNLELNEEQLIELALALGSDCPFFIKNKPSLGSGRGEQLQDIAVDLSGYKIVLVNPKIHINTGWAFSNINPKEDRPCLSSAFDHPVTEWKNMLTNDFEQPVFSKYPEIEDIKNQLYQQGALYASMSGSGSTVYGIFEKNAAPAFAFPEHYYIKAV